MFLIGRYFPKKLDFDGLKKNHEKLTPSQKKKIKNMAKIWRALEKSTLENGSDLRMARSLRDFFLDYNTRVRNLGWGYMPSSFNVFEAFFDVFSCPGVLRLREENEHRIDLNSFVNFIRMQENLEPMKDTQYKLKEGVIYSYDFLNTKNTFLSNNLNEHFILSGVSLVRHDEEVSFFVEIGTKFSELETVSESEDAASENEYFNDRKKVEELRAPEEISIVYLDEEENFQRALIGFRFNINRKEEAVKYIFEDYGTAYLTFSNDPYHMEFLNKNLIDKKIIDQQKLKINLFSPVFQFCYNMIYLPSFLETLVEETTLVPQFTKLKSLNIKDKQNIIKYLPAEERVFKRNITTILEKPKAKENPVTEIFFVPQFLPQTNGYWKPLSFELKGKGKNGEEVSGKTWISQDSSWKDNLKKNFLTLKTMNDPSRSPHEGGYIYVMRSPAQGKNIFKIGKTKKDPEERAEELSSTTSSAVPFLVAQHWWFKDYDKVEKLIHRTLDKYRLNNSREFFRCTYNEILTTINGIHQLTLED